MCRVHARVIVLAGPSGAGKSRLAERLGLPVLRLDDFYKDGHPTYPFFKPGVDLVSTFLLERPADEFLRDTRYYRP